MNPYELPTFEPFNVEAEMAVLGCAIMSPDAIDRIGAISAADFYHEAHRTLWQAVTQMIDAGRPVELLLVKDALDEAGKLDAVGGLAYLGDVCQYGAHPATVSRYADVIRERATLRRLLAASSEVTDIVRAHGLSTAEKVEQARSAFEAVTDTSVTNRADPVDLTTAMLRHVAVIEDRVGGKRSGLPTGFDDLDEAMNGGLRPGQLIIVAARPGMGKTSFALQVALEVAMRGEPSLFCSQEMPEAELMDRAICLTGRMPLSKILAGQLSDHEWSALASATGQMHQKPFYLDEQASLTLQDVRAKARFVKRKAGLKLLVVDYLQLMAGQGDNRNAQIEQISRGLKQLAKEMGIPVMALSQLNRGCEQRTNKRPMVSDLRDSGAIEQDADVILTLYRDEIYNADTSMRGVAELNIGKQRQGQAGKTIPLTFKGAFTRFDNFHGNFSEMVEQSRPAKRASRGFGD